MFGREFGLSQSGGLDASLGCYKCWFRREFGLLHSGGLDASLGPYKVVVMARVWAATKWWFGHKFELSQRGDLGASLGCYEVVFGRASALIPSIGSGASLT